MTSTPLQTHADPATRPALVVLVGADTAIIDRARTLGLAVFLVQTPARFDPACLAMVEGCLIVDYTVEPDLAGYLAPLHERWSVRAAVSVTELGLLPAARLNAAWGTCGVSEKAVEITRDKAAMREALAGIKPLPASQVSSAAEAQAFGEKYGWPIIIKPVDGFGSKAVCRIDAPEQLKDLDWTTDKLLAERFVSGRVLSVEAFSHAGQHVLYSVNEEFPIGPNGPAGSNPYVEVAHESPARLNDLERSALQALLPRILTHLGIDEGCSHTELILGDDGFVVLECHTRPGGDFIPEMLQRCTGIDLLSLAIANPAGLADLPEPPATWPKAAAMRFFTPPAGTVRNVTGVQSCVDVPGVAALHVGVKAGDQIAPMSYCADRVGYVMAIAEDIAAATAVCEDILQRVRIDVDTGANHE